ncbi:PREDICTED: exocyst complex component EXO70A1 isoform X1 [Populus euphratica]|uniref:Exocyst subunit Exo70 family protein n=1 Tax=Populus euphratica TaxID=75702 RepID=A0AAJ6VDQ1_POPEU|nr:PREDICTED: exocyst complex component EXO70A1 isoform X1 [Populus euphratica]
MSQVDGIDNLVASRIVLKTSLENSRALASAFDSTGQRLEGMKQRLPFLEAAVKHVPRQKCKFVAIREHIDRAIGPASAVLKVYDIIQELQKSLLYHPCSDLSTYLLMVKQLEESLKFLADNCGLAIQWLEAILEFLEDNAVHDDLYILNVNKSLTILQELQATDRQARLGGGILCAAFDKLEIEFKQILVENCVCIVLDSFSSSMRNQASTAPSPLPVAVIQKLQAIVERLDAANRLEKCISTYVEVRCLNTMRSFQALDLDYLNHSFNEFDDVQDVECYVDQWCKHLQLAVKQVFETEYKICSDVFEKNGPEVWMDCFAKIVTQSGILSFLRFGKKITECKNDPVKLMKLLDIFAMLDNLRVDFNRLFGGSACIEIQTMTRDLLKGVVNGACEIFWELPIQVELQRRSSPPLDGSVPRLVSFVTDYCNHLLGDDYRPLLTQILTIQQSWKQEKYQEELVTNQIYCIIKQIGLNLDAWSKAHYDLTLSYLFMMNNHCHFCSLKGTNLGGLMGDSWLKAHEQYRDYYMTLYLRESWGKIFASLSQESRILSSPTRGFEGDLFKKRLKSFNEELDHMYQKQSNWVVPCEDLRLKMCKLVVQAYVPLYRSYLQDHGFQAETDASPSRHVKYTTQGLEAMLSSLFQPKLSKSGSTKHNRLIGKIKDMVTDNFRLALMAV